MNRFARLTAAFGVVFAMVLGAPTPAKADPITAAIVTAVGLTGTAAAVATFVVNGLFTTAFSWAAGKLLGKSKASVQERQASVTTLSLGEVPREALIGEAVTGGSLIDAFNHGGQYGTDYVTRCIALVDHAVDDLVGYYIDDQYYAFSANGVQGGFSGALDIEFVNATEAGAAPPARFLTASGGSWVSTDVLAGITHVWFSYKCDEAVWPQGHPQVRFLLRGLKAYDPRKDAALGYVGAGAQTWSDPSTHTFTRNAALLRYAFARGIYAEGRQGEPEHLLIGRGLSAEEAPPEPVIAAANLCDEDVDGKPRYTANGVIRASDDFIFVEEMFAAAMAGVIVQREGGVEIEPGQAKAAVVTIADADLVAGEPVSFSEFLSDGDGGRINTVIPRYIEPAQTWKDHSGPVRRDLADIAADGGPREITLPLMLVTEGAQADRCAEITRLLGRLEKRATIVLPPEYGRLEEGDWIAWTSARRFAGATVRFRIESWTLDEKWRMRLSLREIAAAAYGEPDPVADESDSPSDPVELDPLELQDVTASVVLLEGLPAIQFGWSAPDPAVIAIRAEVRRAGETVAAPTRSDDVTALTMTVTNGVGPDQALEARLVPITSLSRSVLGSPWIALTSGVLTAGDVSETAPSTVRTNDQLLDEAVVRFGGFIAETGRRQALDRETFDRFDVIGVLDPVARTGFIRGEAIQAVDGGLFLDDVNYRTDTALTPSGDIAPGVPTRIGTINRMLDEALSSFERDMAEEDRRRSNAAGVQDVIDVIAVVDPIRRRATLRGEQMYVGAGTLAVVAEKVDVGLDAEGQVALPITETVSRLSNSFNEQIDIADDGTIVREGLPDGNAPTLLGLGVTAAIAETENDLISGTLVPAVAAIANAVPSLSNVLNVAQIPASYLDTDGTLSANSDFKVASQKAVKAYADALIAANDAMVFKGGLDCSTNPNYPAGNTGWTYRASVAGKIGGASGVVVEVGDQFICLTDGTASGNQATVGANWSVYQTNIDGAVVGPASAVDGTPAVFDGTSGKLIKNTTFAAFKTSLSLVKGDVGLGSVDNTADTAKPVSTAQQTALNLKVNLTDLGELTPYYVRGAGFASCVFEDNADVSRAYIYGDVDGQGFLVPGGSGWRFRVNATLAHVNVATLYVTSSFHVVWHEGNFTPASKADVGGAHPAYTVATLPSAAVPGKMIYVSDETGGPVMTFSDGTNWRRMTDRAIVS